MPGKVKVKILAGRNLPVMDRSSDTTDAYVEIKLGNTTYKTDVCRKSLNPQWNSEWYKFEMDDAELQDEPLQIRLMDHDTYSANDSIGKVYLNLNPLLLPPSSDSGPPTNPKPGGSTMSGWLPVYDTMHGIRGEVNVVVKVELFSDFNKFRQSSCGVQFFFSETVPYGFDVSTIHGLVEELIVAGDPEYQWIEKIRAPRVTNESRQTLFAKLSGEVQRKIGLKVLDLGANAVIGYKQCFDLEGESGIVVRGLGTAVTLAKGPSLHLQPPLSAHPAVSSIEDKQDDTKPAKAPQTAATSHSPARLTSLSANIHRRSSDSDLSITPKGIFKKRNSLTGSDKSSLYGGNRGFHQAFPRATILKEHLEMLEYPFFTMSKYPPGFIIHIGGMVGARSVKLIERMNNMEEPVCRDSWWTEIRKEVRTHCRALGCNVVLNYTESTTICDDVCVLSVSGTAAVIQVRGEGGGGPNSVVFADPLEQPPLLTWHKKPAQSQPPVQAAAEKTADSEHDGSAAAANRSTRQRNLSENVDSDAFLPCSICHVAFNHKSVSFHMELSKCINCKKKMVPDILLASIEPPEGLPIAGRGCFIQAFEVRPKGAGRGESNAKEISDGLPFMEFEINKQLVSKLRLSGMNAIFGLKIEVSVGERMVAAHATGTAFMVTCLPVPRVPSVAAGQAFQGNSKLAKVQQMLHDTVKKNRDYYQLRLPSVGNQEVEQSETVADKGENNGEGSESEDSDEDDNANLDPFHGNKEAFILEVDDTHEADSISLLIDPHPPEGFHVVTIECLPNVENLEVVRNLQMFTLVWRSRLPLSYSQMPSAHFNKHFHRLLQGVYFKLRRMTPCALASMCFKIDLPEQDELQITAVGMALGLAESESHGKKENKKKTNTIPNEGVGEMIFSLEEDQNECSPKQSKGSTAPSPTSAATTLHPNKTGAHRSHSPLRPIRRSTHTPPKERYGVDLTPLSYVPGGRIDKYLGNLSFYFIRESTCIRESGGQSGFVHSFLAEVLAIVRAHVTALGGNAMVAYTMSDCTLLNYPAKNHAQCLVNVSGDAVFVSYFPNE
ncbi:C2 domain-containing protein 5 isoform X4 [Nilaparvata lugens]|uniref:C2 domain-containing protein 5 isoform X4 n=1 Tax=Nilaparvata lugens TaxID=108931 RepID=UPI00193E045F|nr:C2 domain-containing protein 5 isoform X4 [Nilaparvata lugens]